MSACLIHQVCIKIAMAARRATWRSHCHSELLSYLPGAGSVILVFKEKLCCRERCYTLLVASASAESTIHVICFYLFVFREEITEIDSIYSSIESLKRGPKPGKFSFKFQDFCLKVMSTTAELPWLVGVEYLVLWMKNPNMIVLKHPTWCNEVRSFLCIAVGFDLASMVSNSFGSLLKLVKLV